MRIKFIFIWQDERPVKIRDLMAYGYWQAMPRQPNNTVTWAQYNDANTGELLYAACMTAEDRTKFVWGDRSGDDVNNRHATLGVSWFNHSR